MSFPALALAAAAVWVAPYPDDDEFGLTFADFPDLVRELQVRFAGYWSAGAGYLIVVRESWIVGFGVMLDREWADHEKARS